MKTILKKVGQFILIPIFILLFLSDQNVYARENVVDWYIKNFDSVITVNKDSSLDITETITADCGEGVNKHGIFRILPTEINVEGKGSVKTPIRLISISNEDGVKYNYTTSKNSIDRTLTWKIGDANKSVQGVNIYVIKYHVDNAIRFWNADTDELYWNLTGNFWDLEIDKAHVVVNFPSEVNKTNSVVDLYSGAAGEKSNLYAKYKWTSDSVIEFDTNRTLALRNGVTTAITFPKNIFVPYQESLSSKYGEYLFLIIPIFVLFLCFKLWQKYGKDPQLNKTVIAEYEAPKDLSLIEAGLLMTNGKMKNHFITASIVGFATNGIISIKEIENKILFFKSKEYQLIRLGNGEAEGRLNKAEKIILDKIFEHGNTTNLSSLKKEFYKVLKKVTDEGDKILASKGLIVASGMKYSSAFFALGALLIFLSIVFIQISQSIVIFVSIFLSGVIFFIFGFIMPKRTQAGAEMDWQLNGFKLFMKTVDKDRAAFYEKENMFEKLLPYAILFEITDLWIKRIKDIYGEDYFANHVPVWYVGTNIGVFNADSFSKSMSDLSHGIAASTSAPSGSGGAGGAGGGGGGGGGGGW